MKTFEINANEVQREIKIEDMSEITLSIEKMPNNQNNQENWKWFLTNQEELNNSKINPIGLNNFSVDCIENRFNFKFKILNEARNITARFSYKESHTSQENENTPKKEINFKISESTIYDVDMLFFEPDDVVRLDVNEISDPDSQEIIIEENKAKNIMIKGQQSNEYAWFIENYNDIKTIIFITKLENTESGKLSYTLKSDNQGFYEFNLKVSVLPNGGLPKIKLIYKKVNPAPEPNQKKDKNIIKKEITLIKKIEKSQRCKNYLNDCNKYTIPIYISQALISILSAIILGFSRSIYEDSLIIDVVSKDLIKDLDFSYITTISNKSFSTEIDSKESNSDDFVFDKWQGTKDGCGKMDGDKPIVNVLEIGKECEKDNEYLEGIPPIEITNYKGFILNVHTPGYISYHDLLYDGSIIKKTEKCPEGKKSCGYIDTKQNILCLDENKDCPINYIKIDKTPPEGITNIKTIKGDQINIYYSNNPYENREGIPYIQVAFKIGEDELCTIPSLYYSNINLFKLDAFIKDYANKCSLKDYTQDYTKILGNYYFSLDTIDNYQLYNDNGIIDRIQNSNLVKYGYDVNKYKNNKLHLYVRTHYGYDKNCLENRSNKYDIKQQLRLMNGIGDKMRTWSDEMYISIASMVIPPLDIFVISNIWSQKDFSSTESLIKNWVNFFVNVASLIFSINANSFDNPGEDLMTCSDDYVNDNYNVMTLKIRNSGKKIFYISLGNLLILLLTLFVGIYKAIIDLKLKKKDSNIIKKYKYKIKELNGRLIKAQKKLLEHN